MKRCACIGLLVLCATAARPAQADAGNGDTKAAAQALFDEGRTLMVQKRFAEACPKLVESLRLDPGIGTRLFLADCYERVGRTASAWAEFREAAAGAAQQHDDREAVAQRRADALEARLTKLVLVVSPPAAVAGLEVRRDGLVVPASELGTPIPVDPGIHVVEASAPSHEKWSSNVELPDGAGSIMVNVPVLAPTTAATQTAPLAPAPAGPVAAPDVSSQLGGSRAWGTQKIVAIGVGAVGVVGLGLGAYFGLHAKSIYDGANSSGDCLPDNECNAAGKQARSDASGWATASTVAFGVGVAAIAGGVVLWLTAPKPASSASLGIVPTIGGLRAVGSF